MKLFLLFLVTILGVTSLQAKYFSTVVIDAGHGGVDGGAYHGGVKESDLNLKVAKRLSYELRKRGIKTVMTRTSDKFLSIGARCAMANRYPNAIFVSIHFNGFHLRSANGLETFYNSSQGYKLASQIQYRLHRNLKRRNRGVKNRGLDILKGTRNISVLVELGFISNYSERQVCITSWYQAAAARSIADGLMAYRRMR